MGLENLTPEVAGQIQFLLMMSATAAPLNLSEGLSINFSKVIRYEPIEKTRTVTKGKGANAEEVEEGTGEFEPAIFFEGSDFITLTPEQNEIFRDVWAAYGRVSREMFSMIGFAFPKQETAAAGGENV